MYATSKLIIPPRPARNSPFIPKLRIKLRPSLSRGRRNNANKHINESGNVTTHEIAGGLSHNSEYIIGDRLGLKHIPGANSNTNEGEVSTSSQNTFSQRILRRRCASKRKHSPNLHGEITVDSPESALTKINLKTIINRETFYSLPIDTQRMLAELLPVCDRQKSIWNVRSDVPDLELLKRSPSQSSAEISLENDAIWLHPTALSNEFFGKALQDYATRLAQGEFSQRARNRAGLRTSVASRSRYAQFTSPDGARDKCTIKNSCCNGVNHPNIVRQNRRVKLHQVSSSQPNRRGRTRRPTIAGCDSAEPSKIKSSSNRTNFVRKANTVSGQSFGPLDKPTSEPSFGEQKPSHIIGAVDSNSSFPSIDSDFHSHTPTASATPVSEASTTQEISAKLSPYSSSLPPTPLFQKSGHLKKSVPSGDQPKSINCSPNSIGSPPTGENLCSSPVSSSRPPRGSRALSANLNSTVHLPMPPPRQTKTLAAMREKLRAKRLMKEAERHEPGQSYYGLPGSMTPHPTSDACGYFHQPAGFLPAANLAISLDATRRSSSALSSPQSLNLTSHFLCDKELSAVQISVSDRLPESSSSKISSNSPSSPQSLSTADALSPIINSALSSDFMASFGEQNTPSLTFDSVSQFLPTSPHSTTSPGSTAGIAFSYSSHSPCPVKPHQITRCEPRQEQSASAPPTPLSPHFGRGFYVGHTPASPIHSVANLTGISDNLQNLAVSSASVLTASGLSLRSATGTDIQPASVCDLTNLPTPSPPNSSSSSFATSFASSPAPGHLSLSTSSPASSHNSLQPQLHASHSYPSFSIISQSAAPVPLQPSQVSSMQAHGPSINGGIASTIDFASSVSSLPPAVSQLLTGTTSSRPSTTTRAFFVDGDNLSQALALLQSLNPNATITQQQFLLIPSSNKSQMFLCRPPSDLNSITASTVPSSVTLSVPRTPISLSLQEPSVAFPSPSTNVPNTIGHQTALPSQLSDSNFNYSKGCSYYTENNGLPLNIKPRAIRSEAPISSACTFVHAPTDANAASKTVVCSKAASASQLVLSPNVIPLKPHMRTVPSADLESHILGPRQRSGSPKSILSTNTVSMCVAPANHSQVTFSLLAQKASLSGRDTPLVLFSDPVRQSTAVAQQGNLQMDLIQASFVGTPNFMQGMSNAGCSIVAPPHFTVINSSGSISSCPQFTNQSETIAILPNSSYNASTLQPHYNSHSMEHIAIAAQPTVSITNTDRYTAQQLTTNYMPATTLVSHGSSALVFPPAVHAVQPKHRPFGTNRSDDAAVNFSGSSSS